MNRSLTRAWALVLGFVVAVGAAAPVLAQRTPEELARLNGKAMEAYHNLEVDQARDMLENAIRDAEAGGVEGEELARAYVSLGVVYLGGLDDEEAALAMFESGLREDGAVEVDPVVSTPEISAVFDRARTRAFEGGSSAAGAPAAGGNLIHSPVEEQRVRTGVPVYVEAPAGVDVAVVRIFYRSAGMGRPASADLPRLGDGWGYVVPCQHVSEPTVEYFLVALDASGTQVGNLATPQAPVVVPIVASLSGVAPALPGQPPPEGCGGVAACTPGTPGCGAGDGAVASAVGGLGDTCRRSSECGDGLTCRDNFCALPREESEGPDDSPPRMFLRVGGTLGVAYVKDGMPAVGSPDPRYYNDRTPADPDNPTAEEVALLEERFAEANYACDLGPGATPTDCEVQLNKNGLSPTAAVRFEAGGFVTDRVALSLVGRFQFNAGGGTLGGILLGGRVGYLLVEPQAKGFQPSLFGGFTVGQIQPQPKPASPPDGLEQEDGPPYYEESPHVRSGLFGLHAGVHLGYRFVRNFGIYVAPEVDLLMPDLLFDMDVTGGVEVAF